MLIDSQTLKVVCLISPQVLLQAIITGENAFLYYTVFHSINNVNKNAKQDIFMFF